MLVRKTRLALMLVAVAASSIGLAAHARGSEDKAQATVAAPADATAGSTASSYVLGSDDKLRITVFGEEKLTGEYAVSTTGMISFPLIGDVPVTGKSLSEVQDVIRSRLAAGYLNDPRVAIDVIQYRTFYILGEVNKPGEYPYRTNLTLEQAVATAGGYTYRANRKRFVIAHSNGAPETTMRLKEVSAPKIEPGDTIRVPERFF